jgi:hypothetical protein
MSHGADNCIMCGMQVTDKGSLRAGQKYNPKGRGAVYVHWACLTPDNIAYLANDATEKEYWVDRLDDAMEQCKAAVARMRRAGADVDTCPKW